MERNRESVDAAAETKLKKAGDNPSGATASIKATLILRFAGTCARKVLGRNTHAGRTNVPVHVLHGHSRPCRF